MELTEAWNNFDLIRKESTPLQVTVTIKECKCKCEIIYRDLSYICSNCGVVLSSDNISDEPEWNNYSDDTGTRSNTQERCGLPINPLYPNGSLSTKIGNGNNVLFSKIVKLHNRFSWTSEERRLYDIQLDINDIVVINQFPKRLINQTMLVYNDFIKTRKIYRGAVKIGIVCACFYQACKYNNICITATKVSEMFGITNEVFGKCYQILQDITDVSDEYLLTSLDLLDRYLCELNISYKIQKLCKKILASAEELDILIGNSPQCIGAAIIYFVNIELKLELNNDSIVKLTNYSMVTINKIHKILNLNKTKIYTMIQQQ